MNPANFYYPGYPGQPYSSSGYGYPSLMPMTPGLTMYPYQHPRMAAPMMHGVHPPPQSLYAAPSVPSLSAIPPSHLMQPLRHNHPPPQQQHHPQYQPFQPLHPGQRKQSYHNLQQNEFSRGFEFDYDFLSSESTLPYSGPSRCCGDTAAYGGSQSLGRRSSFTTSQDPRRLSLASRASQSSHLEWNTRQADPLRAVKRRLAKGCQRTISQAGVLFSAIFCSVCECLLSSCLSPPSRGDCAAGLCSGSMDDIKLLAAFDGSRLDLSKLTLPHDRLLTEDSIENLEFEILECRANRLDKSDRDAAGHRFVQIGSKKNR